VLCENTLQFYSYPAMAPAPSLQYAPIKGVVQVALDEALIDQPARLGLVSLCVIKRQSLWLVVLDHTGWSVYKVRRYYDRGVLTHMDRKSLFHAMHSSHIASMMSCAWRHYRSTIL